MSTLQNHVTMPLSLSYNIKRDGSTTTGSSGQQSPSYSQSTNDSSEEAIMSSIVYCIHHKDGCNWSDELRKLKGHLNTCRYDAVACPSQCGAMIPRLLLEDHLRFTCNLRRTTCQFCSKIFTAEELDNHHGSCGWEPVYCENKCGSKCQRKNMSTHLSSECTKRLVQCESCKREFMADTLATHQIKCGRVPIPCPNQCGSLLIPREELESHMKEKCSEIMTTCIFKDAGCKFKGQKQRLETHLNDNCRQHLSLLCGIVTKQQQQISCLRSALAKLSLNHSGTLIWKINDFAAKMRDAKSKEGVELISAPFYTSQYGYKLQASVFLNGNGVGEGSQVSVYIKLLPGEYDSILKWPFANTVSFTLYDQNPTAEKTINIVESFVPDATWKNFQRPSREPDALGFGFPRFVSHDTLLKRNYIRDDTLFLRIKVDPPKPIPV